MKYFILLSLFLAGCDNSNKQDFMRRLGLHQELIEPQHKSQLYCKDYAEKKCSEYEKYHPNTVGECKKAYYFDCRDDYVEK